MPQALQTNAATDLAAAADRIKGLMRTVAVSTVDLGVELKRVRDAHFPLVKVRMTRGATKRREGWPEWLKANFKMTPFRASQLIRVAEAFASKVNLRVLPGTVLEQMMQVVGREEVEQEIIAENEASLRTTGLPISQRRARAIVSRHRRNRQDHPGDQPQLPTASEAQAIARAQREVGNVVLIPARDGNFYTGADESEVSAHEKARDLALMVEYAVDTLLKVELTPHEYMAQTPQWLRWWRTKEGHLSTKGRKLREVAHWLTALATAVESAR